MIKAAVDIPERQIRAQYNSDTLTVYQAYREAIARPALEAQKFVPPFKMDRMTWIKPSFLWMMYRSGWGGKPGQEFVLSIDITRNGFEWALENSCLSHFDANIYSSHEAWKEILHHSPVRIQWDPEKDIHLNPLPHRSIQIGLSGEAVYKYVNEWIVAIRLVTPLISKIQKYLDEKDIQQALDLLPKEKPYPLTEKQNALLGVF